MGFEIKRDEVTSLRRLLDHDIAAHLDKITEVSDQASRCAAGLGQRLGAAWAARVLEPAQQGAPLLRVLIPRVPLASCREWSIEKALDKMEADWEGLTFELGSWKETGGWPCAGVPGACVFTLPPWVLARSAQRHTPSTLTILPHCPHTQGPSSSRVGPWRTRRSCWTTTSSRARWEGKPAQRAMHETLLRPLHVGTPKACLLHPTCTSPAACLLLACCRPWPPPRLLSLSWTGWGRGRRSWSGSRCAAVGHCTRFGRHGMVLCAGGRVPW